MVGAASTSQQQHGEASVVSLPTRFEQQDVPASVEPHGIHGSSALQRQSPPQNDATTQPYTVSEEQTGFALSNVWPAANTRASMQLVTPCSVGGPNGGGQKTNSGRALKCKVTDGEGKVPSPGIGHQVQNLQCRWDDKLAAHLLKYARWCPTAGRPGTQSARNSLGFVLRLSPLAFAGWLGLLVTALNLLPIGQLDGGHMARAMFGRRIGETISSVAMWSLFLLAIFVWPGLLFWALLVFFMAGRGTPPLNDLTPISSSRRWIGYATFLSLALILIPLPHAFWDTAGVYCPYL